MQGSPMPVEEHTHGPMQGPPRRATVTTVSRENNVLSGFLPPTKTKSLHP